MLYLKVTDFWDREYTYGPYNKILWKNGGSLCLEDGTILIDIGIDIHADPLELEPFCDMTSDQHKYGYHVKGFCVVGVGDAS